MRLALMLALVFAAELYVFARDAFDSSRVDAYFEALKDLPFDLSTAPSAVEEELVRLELYKTFPPTVYSIEKNIFYYSNNRVLGELDIVVRLRANNKVVLIAEVKRGKHLSALNQANSQLTKFGKAMDRRRVKRILSGDDSIVFSLENFRQPWEKRVYGIRTAESAHYNNIIDITERELRELRERMRHHQRQVFAQRSPTDPQHFSAFWLAKTKQFHDMQAKTIQRVGCGIAFNGAG